MISLIPDLMLDDIYKITPEFLRKEEIQGVLFDIDNTLVPYDTEAPDEKLRQFFSSIEQSGIVIGLVSNNDEERVSLFNKTLGYFSMHKAGKPSIKGIIQFMTHHKLNPKYALFVGDQLFTDCLAAHRAGIRCIIVKPLGKDKGTFFKLKRALEKPFIWIYKLRHHAR